MFDLLFLLLCPQNLRQLLMYLFLKVYQWILLALLLLYFLKELPHLLVYYQDPTTPHRCILSSLYLKYQMYLLFHHLKDLMRILPVHQSYLHLLIYYLYQEVLHHYTLSYPYLQYLMCLLILHHHLKDFHFY